MEGLKKRGSLCQFRSLSNTLVPPENILAYNFLMSLSLDPKFRYSGGPPDFLQNSQIEHSNYV